MFGWAHSCCSHAALEAALNNSQIDKIESDIMVSRETGECVMMHPPAKHSDLTFDAFFAACVADQKRHLKLDFKEFEAVSPCLKRVAKDRELLGRTGQTVWLNADVLPGPGKLSSEPVIPKDAFVSECVKWYPEGILSLGWKVDVMGSQGYNAQHCEEMASLLEAHGLASSPVVLAVAARLVALDPYHLRQLLFSRLPRGELLLWTGTGEAPVDAALVERLKAELCGTGEGEALAAWRVGFDVALAA